MRNKNLGYFTCAGPHRLIRAIALILLSACTSDDSEALHLTEINYSCSPDTLPLSEVRPIGESRYKIKFFAADDPSNHDVTEYYFQDRTGCYIRTRGSSIDPVGLVDTGHFNPMLIEQWEPNIFSERDLINAVIRESEERCDGVSEIGCVVAVRARMMEKIEYIFVEQGGESGSYYSRIVSNDGKFIGFDTYSRSGNRKLINRGDFR